MKYLFIFFCLTLVIIVGNMSLIFLTQNKISSGSPINQSRSGKALLIIDLQKDLTEVGGKLVMDTTQTNSIIEKLNRITKRVSSKDWKVIFVKQVYKTDPLLNLLTNNALKINSKGAQLDKRISIPVESIQIIKHTKDAFNNTELDAILERENIGKLYILGIDAEHCVGATIEAGRKRSYDITIIQDAVGAKNKNNLSMKFNEWSNEKVNFLKSDEIK